MSDPNPNLLYRPLLALEVGDRWWFRDQEGSWTSEASCDNSPFQIARQRGFDGFACRRQDGEVAWAGWRLIYGSTLAMLTETQKSYEEFMRQSQPENEGDAKERLGGTCAFCAAPAEEQHPECLVATCATHERAGWRLTRILEIGGVCDTPELRAEVLRKVAESDRCLEEGKRAAPAHELRSIIG